MKITRKGQSSMEISKRYNGFGSKEDNNSRCTEPEICGKDISEKPTEHVKEKAYGEESSKGWDLEISKPADCFSQRDSKRYHMDEEMPDCPVSTPLEKTENKIVQSEPDSISGRLKISKPDQSFKSKAKRIGPLARKNTELLNQKTADVEHSGKAAIKAVVDMLVYQRLFICLKGQNLYMKEYNSYTCISVSPAYEIMHLKKLFKEYGMSLSSADCKAILCELKTEPDIWVNDLEQAENGNYNISFCSGERLNGAEGKFDDFMVCGQIQNKLKPYTEGIRLFVAECCDIIRGTGTESMNLFHAYENFMAEYPDYLLARINQFIPYIKTEYGLQGGSNGRVRVIKEYIL